MAGDTKALSLSLSLPPRFFLDIDFRPNGPEAGNVERARSLSLNNLWYIEPLPGNPRTAAWPRIARPPGPSLPLSFSFSLFPLHAAGLVFPFNNRASERREDWRPASTTSCSVKRDTDMRAILRLERARRERKKGTMDEQKKKTDGEKKTLTYRMASKPKNTMVRCCVLLLLASRVARQNRGNPTGAGKRVLGLG